MLTNREVRDGMKRLQGNLEGYIQGINRLPAEALDEEPQVVEEWYRGLVKEVGGLLVMLGDVNPG